MTHSVFSSANRKNPRHSVSIEVLLWSQQQRVQGCIADLAEGGCRLSCDEKLAVNEEMHLRFDLPYTTTTIRCDGCIVWSGGEPCGAGVEFLRMSEADRRRIAHWLENNSASGEIVL
jgi:hypothetical protein